MIQNKIAKDTEAKLAQSLNAVLETSHHAVKSWLDEHKSTVSVWSHTPEVLQAATTLLAISHKQSELLASNVQAQLRSWFQPLQQATGYLGYFIIGPDNINLASSRDQNIGVENLLIKQKQFLRLVWSGETAISLPEKSDVPLPDSEGQLREGLPSMFVGSPILNKAGKVIAIFTLRINPEEDFTTLLQKGRIGDTGETYAFDRKGLLISNSRFDDQLRDMGLISAEERGILNIVLRDPGVNLLQVETSDVSRVQLPLTQMAASAITGKSASNLAGYRDYRGVTVVGAWLWDKQLGFGIAIELDKQEAYQTLRTTQNVILTLTTLIILLLIGMTIIFVIYHQRRQAEEALQKSEESFRMLVEQSPIGIGISVKGQIRYVNPAYLCMFDYDKETNLAGTSLLDNIAPECQEEISDRIARRFCGEGVPNRYETTGLKLDGSMFPFELEAYLLELPDGQATVAFLTDLSERKQAEEALQRSEVLERLSTGAPLNEILTALVINAEKHNTEMLCSVLLLDEDGKHLLHGAAPSLPDYYNEAIDGIEIGPDIGCCGAAAYSGEQVIANDIMSHLNWVNFRKLAERASLRACCSEPIISSTGVILGTFAIYYRELRVPTQPALDFIHDSARLAGIAIERKQAEAALRNNEQQLRLITDNIPAFVAYVDSELHFRFNNKKYEYWFGMSQEELRGKHVKDVLGENSYQIQKERYAKVLSGIPVEFEYSIQFIDNKEHYISGSFIPDISDNGVTKGFFALVIDITERRQAEEALRKSEARLKRAQSVAHVGSWDLDIPNNSLLWSDETYRIFGIPGTEVLTYQKFIEHVHPDDVAHLNKAWETALAGQEYDEEHRIVVDGETKWVHEKSYFEFDKEGNAVRALGTVQDITERKQAEEQTRQHQADLAHMARLNTMGELATGIAHELNQPLSAINTYAAVSQNLLTSDVNQQQKLSEVLEAIGAQAMRASEIIRRLRQFVKKQTPQKTMVVLNNLVQEVLTFTEPEIKKKNVQLQLELADRLPEVCADAIQIEQVLVNLIRNSLEAMELTMTKNRQLAIRTYLNQNGLAQVEVTDTGSGIDGETLSHIFESFVTTKGAKGMGIGLSISSSIIEGHGGHLWAKSEPGKGASFFFTLPLNNNC